MNPIEAGGIQIILFFQHLGGWLAAPMQLFSFLGRVEFFLLIAPAMYWCLDAAAGMRVAVALLLSASLNDVLKIVFHTPRPYWIDPQIKTLSSDPYFGLPSGHAQNAVAVWGSLAYSIHTRWAGFLAAALIILIGLSRIYLAVHFPLDVLAGWAVGVILLLVYLRLEQPVIAWLKTLRVWTLSLFLLGSSLALILLGWGARAAVAQWQLPAAWIDNARAAQPNAAPINPLDITDVFTNAGAFLGLTLGGALVSRRGGFVMRAEAWRLAVRFLVGVAGVLILWQGLGSLLPEGETPLAFAFRYARYTLIGFWITGLAPAVFVRFSLSSWDEKRGDWNGDNGREKVRQL